MLIESKSSENVARIVAEVKEELKSSVTKHNEDTVRLLRELHEDMLETSDSKILESIVQNQSALTAKSVVDTLRTDPAFSRTQSDFTLASPAHPPRSKDFEDKVIDRLAGFVIEMEKISGVANEVLSSVKDLKVSKRFVTSFSAPFVFISMNRTSLFVWSLNPTGHNIFSVTAGCFPRRLLGEAGASTETSS